MFDRFKKKEESNDQSKSDADALIEKVGVAFAEKLSAELTPIKQQVETLSSKWNKMEEEANASIAEESQNKNADGSEVTEEQKRVRREEMLFAGTVMTNARITESEVIGRVQAEYPQIVEAARQAFQATDWKRKAQKDYPQYCENVINMLVGQEARKGGLRYNQSAGKFMIEDTAARTREKDSPLNDAGLTWQNPMNPNQVLTASEQLRKLGIDEKEFEENFKTGRLM